VGETVAELASHRRRQAIPTTFVALHGAQVVGSASLLLEDMPATDRWTPWLASVFVAPAWRGKGIGQRLVRRAVSEAAALGVETLHLFTTEATEWYRDQGWRVVEQRPHEGETATIMDLDLRREGTTFQLVEPTPWRRTMSEWSDRWQAILSDFERQRDELKVRVHLAKAEAREEMARLEAKMDDLRLRAQSAGSEAKDALKDIGGAAEQLANEIRIGLDRVRKTL
jgi:N-acetylglutamate synthase-like GNAT family acetyltransferase